MEQLELDFGTDLYVKRAEFEYVEGLYVVEAGIVETVDDIVVESLVVYNDGKPLPSDQTAVTTYDVIRAYEIDRETKTGGNAWDANLYS